MNETMPTKVYAVTRADDVPTGDEFFDLIEGSGHRWVVTRTTDPDNRVQAMSLHDHRLAFFGEAQLVWWTGAELD